jgi:hypothetical protein
LTIVLSSEALKVYLYFENFHPFLIEVGMIYGNKIHHQTKRLSCNLIKRKGIKD